MAWKTIKLFENDYCKEAGDRAGTGRELLIKYQRQSRSRSQSRTWSQTTTWVCEKLSEEELGRQGGENNAFGRVRPLKEKTGPPSPLGQ